MQTLKFIVKGQIISLDPECDTTNLVPGSSGYLRAEFSFSSEWDNTVKVAAFFSNLGKEYPPQKLERGRTCIIPAEALSKSIFKVQVIGQTSKHTLVTNKVKVYQKGGRA